MTHFQSTRNTVGRKSTSSARPSVTSASSTSSIKSIAQKIKRSMDANAQDYWGRPHVFYPVVPTTAPISTNPRASLDSERSTESTSSIKSMTQSLKSALNTGTEDYWGRAHPLSPNGSAVSTPSSTGSEASGKSMLKRFKNSIDRGTDEYWSNQEARAAYFALRN